MEVPIDYKCPRCGKWGRRLTADHVFAITGNLYHNSIERRAHAYYYCNPKARKGGPGCGEVFRRIKHPACEPAKKIWDQITPETNYDRRPLLERMVEMGHRMIEALKQSKYYNPTKRTIQAGILRSFFDEGAKCNCGCGRPSNHIGANGRYYESAVAKNKECEKVYYTVSQLIANPGVDTLNFIADLRGMKCEKCGSIDGPFDLDHILEVKEGGGQCWIDNFQILCRNTCHKEKTAAFAAKRAKRNRETKDKASPQIKLQF